MKRVLVAAALVLVALFALAPLAIVALTSLKNEQEMFANVLGLPAALRFANYATVWVQRGFSGFFVNSILITLPVVAIVLLCSALAGFAISKMRFRGRQLIFYIILLGLMIPLPSLIIPLYKDLSLMRLLDTRLRAILPEAAIALPFGVFLMRTFFNNVNDELLEAARIEGAGELQVLARIVAPLAGPGLKSLALIEFMWAWQSYLLPLVIIRSEAIKPLTVSLDLFVGRFSTSYTLIAAAAVIVFIPITIVYVFTQKAFVQGLTMGSIK